MVLRRDARGLGFGTLTGIAMLGAAGCQSGGTEALDSAKPAVEREKITQSELLAFCPPVGLREGTAFFTTYENVPPPRRSARNDASEDAAGVSLAEEEEAPGKRVVYQTSITDVTRSCTRANGMLNMKIGVAGKVVPGSAGRAGTVNLPIRIAVLTGDTVLFTQLYRYSVDVANTSTATQFLFTTSDVSFADPNTRAVRAFAGFDEGPPKDAASN